MKISTLALLSAMTLGVATSASAEIVYQDTFDAADGIGVNTGIGGGIVSGTNVTQADPFDDATGEAVAQTAFGNRVAWAHTANQFNLSGGFTLDVTFTTPAIENLVTTWPSFTASFGIVDEVTAVTPDANGVGGGGNLNGYLYGDQADLNTVGFSAANRPTHTSATDPGIYTDFGTLASASTALNAAIVYGTTQTFSMTVNADGSADFSLDAANGSLAAGALSSLFTDSVDGEYYFVAYSQGNTGLSLSDVTITAVPEPGSLALLGLGGLLIARRRRG